MTEAVATKRKIRVNPVVAAGSKFDRYKPEEEKDVRKAEVKENPALVRLLRAYNQLLEMRMEDAPTGPPWDEGWAHRYAMALLALHESGKLVYHPVDVQQFLLALVDLDFVPKGGFEKKDKLAVLGDTLGPFLSVLTNSGRHRGYRLHVDHLDACADEFDNPLIMVGGRNTKTLEIFGNVGTALGCKMKSGLIRLNGNAGMSLGLGMTGGAIIINGNVGLSLGAGMRGGEIHVNGDIADFGEGYDVAEQVSHGKIYCKWELVVDK